MRIGVVIRPDGTVPFDADCPSEVKQAILQHITSCGETFDSHEDHVKIHNWESGKTLATSH